LQRPVLTTCAFICCFAEQSHGRWVDDLDGDLPSSGRVNLSPAVVSHPPAAAASIDTNELQEAVRAIIKKELIRQTTAINTQVARIVCALQSHQAQPQWQQQQVLTAAIDEPAVLEQKVANAKQQIEYLLARGNAGDALLFACNAPQTELIYYCCEAANLTAKLQPRCRMIPYSILFSVIDRLCDHITGNTDAAQVENILNWIQDICVYVTDGYLTVNANELRGVIERAVGACGTAHTDNRRLVGMTVHLLQALFRE
jgi:hypothetical protein